MKNVNVQEAMSTITSISKQEIKVISEQNRENLKNAITIIMENSDNLTEDENNQINTATQIFNSFENIEELQNELHNLNKILICNNRDNINSLILPNTNSSIDEDNIEKEISDEDQENRISEFVESHRKKLKLNDFMKSLVPTNFTQIISVSMLALYTEALVKLSTKMNWTTFSEKLFSFIEQKNILLSQANSELTFYLLILFMTNFITLYGASSNEKYGILQFDMEDRLEQAKQKFKKSINYQ